MRGFAYLLVTDRSVSFRTPQIFALSSQIGGNQEVFSPQFPVPIRLYGVTPPIRHRVGRRRSAEKKNKIHFYSYFNESRNNRAFR